MSICHLLQVLLFSCWIRKHFEQFPLRADIRDDRGHYMKYHIQKEKVASSGDGALKEKIDVNHYIFTNSIPIYIWPIIQCA